METKDYTNCGCVNGWNGNVPEPVLKCNEQKHETIDTEILNCFHEVRCDICKIKFTYDSGG